VQRHGLGQEYHREQADGTWALKLPAVQETKRLSEEAKLEDILLVVTYSGTTPEWPIQGQLVVARPKRKSRIASSCRWARKTGSECFELSTYDERDMHAKPPLTPKSVRPASVLQPYCNRADTHWYAMDTRLALAHPKPPK
jgi:hypothetical protein